MSHCSNPVTCPNGNCEGCKKGVVWCQDPRCQPFCAECSLPEEHSFAVNVVFIIIILILIAMIFILLFSYGPKVFYYQKPPKEET